ncbi:6f933b2e-f80a-418e-a329-5552657bce17 [Sclerotinia trifoliorum]|uniref:6f933b2e-f80a-418e-a329-5552657bce17 n=1 Tax=Sclerotinia trifoliorum TaxID=28548 RepID=A0A8H2VPL5_9HELO|nr:6f933b2e-f80a-418e-a329-5552657bce17 [Sclerotinia trifoliorum]
MRINIGWRSGGLGRHFERDQSGRWATNYLKHKLPTVEETRKNTEGEASGYSLAVKSEELYQKFNTRGRRRYDATIPRAIVAASKRMDPFDDLWGLDTPDPAYQGYTEALKLSAAAVLGTRPSSRPNKRKRTEPGSDIFDN